MITLSSSFGRSRPVRHGMAVGLKAGSPLSAQPVHPYLLFVNPLPCPPIRFLQYRQSVPRACARARARAI